MLHFLNLFLSGILALYSVKTDHLLDKSNEHFTLYFFLLEDCRITQAYIPEINEIQKKYSSDQFTFKAVFSNPSSSPDSVYRFLDQYPLDMEVVFDEDQVLARRFDINTMPEVVVYHEEGRKPIYQGRIDNWFVALGKRRAKPTVRDLRICLDQIKHGNIPTFKKTMAIGCFLEKP